MNKQNLFGWGVVGVLWLACNVAGWLPVLMLVLSAIALLLWVAHINDKQVSARMERAAAESGRRQAAANEELQKTLKEVQRLRAHITGSSQRKPGANASAPRPRVIHGLN
jgi:hypothetical protein